jgi:hypothetical protein
LLFEEQSALCGARLAHLGDEVGDGQSLCPALVRGLLHPLLHPLNSMVDRCALHAGGAALHTRRGRRGVQIGHRAIVRHRANRRVLELFVRKIIEDVVAGFVDNLSDVVSLNLKNKKHSFVTTSFSSFLFLILILILT